jgi:hypothetical protein
MTTAITATTTASAATATATTATTTTTVWSACDSTLTLRLPVLLLLDALRKNLEKRCSISAAHPAHQALSFFRLLLLLCLDQSLLSLEPLAISFQGCDAISAGTPSGCERSLNGLNAASRTDPSDKHRTNTRHASGLRTRRTQALIRSIFKQKCYRRDVCDDLHSDSENDGDTCSVQKQIKAMWLGRR